MCDWDVWYHDHWCLMSPAVDAKQIDGNHWRADVEDEMKAGDRTVRYSVGGPMPALELLQIVWSCPLHNRSRVYVHVDAATHKAVRELRDCFGRTVPFETVLTVVLGRPSKPCGNRFAWALVADPPRRPFVLDKLELPEIRSDA